VPTLPPSATADRYEAVAGERLTVPADRGVLANDSDPDDDPITATQVDGPASGTLELKPDGSFSYVPDTGFVGIDRFRYFATDGASRSDAVPVDIEVQALTDVPVTASDRYAVDEDGRLEIAAAEGLLANDSEPGGRALTAELVQGPPRGTVTLDASGAFVYSPNAEVYGEDTFSYRARSAVGVSLPQIVTIDVAPINDPPTITSTAATAAIEGVAFIDTVTATDPDGDPIRYELRLGPIGMALDPSSGAITWTPRGAQSGDNQVVVAALDPSDAADERSYTITVEGRNDPPVIVSSPPTLATVGERYRYPIEARDPDRQDVLEYELDRGPVGLALTAGVVEWVPTLPSTATVAVTVRDRAGATAQQSWTITAQLKVPPQASFRTSHGHDVASIDNGARLLAVSSESAGDPASNAFSAAAFTGVSWAATDTSADATLELAASSIVDRIVLVGSPRSSSPRRFSVLSSTASADPTDMALLVEGTLANHGGAQTFTVTPQRARFVQLVLHDNHGHASSLRLTRFSVHGRAREGGIVSLAEGGGRVQASTGITTRPAQRAIDFDRTGSWLVRSSTAESLTVALIGGRSHLVDRVRIGGSGATTSVRAFDVAVSNTTPDDAAFRVVLSRELEPRTTERWFTFEPTAARWVRLIVRSTYGNDVAVNHFQVYAADLGGPTVPFDNLSTDDAGIVRAEWSFGDGERSTQRHPIHTFAAPGTYEVRLTVTDDTGLTDTATQSFTVLSPPVARIVPEERVVYESLAEYRYRSLPVDPDGQVLTHRWTFDHLPRPIDGAVALVSFRDSGAHGVRLTVTDDQLLTDTATEAIDVLNLAPRLWAGADQTVVWGEPWSPTGRLDETGADDSIITVCSWDFGDGTTEVVDPCVSHDGLRSVAKAYDEPGAYVATVTVTDDDGGRAVDSLVATVSKRQTVAIVRDVATSSISAGHLRVIVRLLDRYDPNRPSVGAAMRFDKDGASVLATTNGSGDAVAIVDYTSGAAGVVRATFDGDRRYDGTSMSRVFDPSRPVASPPPTNGNRGREFVLGFTQNRNRDGTALYFALSSRSHNVVTVDIPSFNFRQTRELAPNVVETVALPSGFELPEDQLDRVLSRGVRIEAFNPLSVYGANLQDTTSDMYLGLPTARVGTDYVLANYGLGNGAGIIGTEDGTTVTVVPTVDLNTNGGVLPAGVPVTYQLDALDAVLIDSHPTLDATGTEITADKPITVLAHNSCANIPAGPRFCDHLAEHLPPTNTWGRSFLTAPLATRTSGEFFRIVASTDGTAVVVDGVDAGTIDRGQFIELDVPSDAYRVIETSAPALVTQFAKSTETDNQLGDPSMIMVVPTEQFGTDYSVTTPPQEIRDYSDWLNIVAPTAALGGLRLDGAPITTTWVPIGAGGASGWSATQVAIADGTHRVRHVSPIVSFGVYAYGWAFRESYGYPGELRLTPLDGSCVPMSGPAGDLADNDCDGRADEELANGDDDDGDTLVDEDLAFGTEAQNTPPVAHDAARSLSEGQTIAIVLGASDPNGDPLTFDVITPPANGTLLVHSSQASPTPLPSLTDVGPLLMYRPSSDFSGTDQFQFVARDDADASAPATYRLDVADINDPPVLTWVPVTDATQDVPYDETLTVTDADPGDTAQFVLRQGPSGMSLDGVTGRLTWTPRNADAGEHSVTVEVIDGGGAIDSRSFVLTVEDVNDAPEFATLAPTDAVLGVPYTYDANATDPDRGERLFYELVLGPVGMTVNGRTGLVQWLPDGMPRTSSVTIRATDLGQLAAEQSYVLTVRPDEDPPTLVVTITPDVIDPGQPITIALQASDEHQVASVSLEIDGTAVPLDANGAATVTSMTPGVHQVVAQATDAGGNVTTVRRAFGVRDASDATPPTATLTSPAEDAIITAPTDILAVADDDNLLRWTLSLARGTDQAFVELARGASATNGVLHRLDPTLRRNGIHRLKLEVTDTNGVTTTAIRAVTIEGGMKVGAFQLTFVDLTMPVAGIPVSVVRSYDSRDKASGEFGVGWRLRLAAGALEHNRTPGTEWSITRPPGPLTFPCNQVNELAGHYTDVRLSDREYYRFALEIRATQSQAGGCLAQVGFRQIGGVASGASLEILSNDVVFHQNGSDTLLDDTSFRPWTPELVELTTSQGVVAELDHRRGITRLAEPNGNALFITSRSIAHSSGEGVVMARDSEGRIVQVTDPQLRTLRYVYDSRGDLVAFIDREGNRTAYSYDDDHNLLEINDPIGNRAVRTEYDADGRLIATIDALGNRRELTHDIEGRREVSLDRLGNATVHEYDEEGNIVAMTNPLGERWTMQVDGDGNVTRIEDPEGNAQSFEYDVDGRETARVDGNGGRWTTNYDARGNVTSTVDPEGNTRTSTYDAAGNLVSRTDATGATWMYTNDADGNTTEVAGPEGGVSSFAYTPAGRLANMTPPNGVTSTFTHDATGRFIGDTSEVMTADGPMTVAWSYDVDAHGQPMGVVGPDGASFEVLRDPLGELTGSIDAMGRRWTLDYDALGRPVGHTPPVGNAWAASYDAEGRNTAFTAPTGDLFERRFDAAGRIIRRVLPNGSATAHTYDRAGRKTSTTDARGSETLMRYDAAGHLVELEAPGGAITRFTRDATGRPVETTRPEGSVWGFTYDAEGRTTAVTAPDGPSLSVTRDSLGRVTSQTLIPGTSLQYTYGARGLSTILDPLGGTTSYQLDPRGLVEGATDALGRSLALRYDEHGRLRTREWPGGRTESWSYDATGRPTASSGPGGTTTFERDHNGRVVRRVDPDGTVTNTTYNGFDHVTAVEDSGGRTAISRDAIGLMTRWSPPSGSVVDFRYDSALNPSGYETVRGESTRAFNPRNELIRVTDPTGLSVGYTRDLEGRATSTTLPFDVVATETFDGSGRPTSLRYDGVGGVLLDLVYTRDGTGRITAIEERVTARTTVYAYDDLGRLTSEAVTANGNTETVTYAYDAVGNLTERAEDGTTTSRSYDASDQLTSDGTWTYAWGDDGTLASRTDGTITERFTHDVRGWLTQFERTGTDAVVVRYAYDFDGLIAARTVDGVTQRFVWDRSLPLPQLVELQDASNAELVSWTRGDHISWRHDHRTDEVSVLLTDAAGSVRAVVDDSGAVIGRIEYDAWGTPLQGTTRDRMFAGEYRDSDSGLIFLRARWYAPQHGRFTSLDAANPDPYDPRTLNRYLYALADPVNNSDPTGLQTLSNVMVAQSVVGILSSIAVQLYPSIGSAVFDIGARGRFHLHNLSALVVAPASLSAQWGLPSLVAGSEVLLYSELGVAAMYLYAGVSVGGFGRGASGTLSTTLGQIFDTPRPHNYEGPVIGVSGGVGLALNRIGDVTRFPLSLTSGAISAGGSALFYSPDVAFECNDEPNQDCIADTVHHSHGWSVTPLQVTGGSSYSGSSPSEPRPFQVFYTWYLLISEFHRASGFTTPLF